MEQLAKRDILTYSKFDEPLSDDQIAEFMKHLPEWELTAHENIPCIERSYVFDDFMGAVDFSNQVAEISEDAHHHPDLIISWGKCKVRWWTFVGKRLHDNDFIMAARTDLLYKG